MPKDIGTDPQQEPPSGKRALKSRQSGFLRVLEKKMAEKGESGTPLVS